VVQHASPRKPRQIRIGPGDACGPGRNRSGENQRSRGPHGAKGGRRRFTRKSIFAKILPTDHDARPRGLAGVPQAIRPGWWKKRCRSSVRAGGKENTIFLAITLRSGEEGLLTRRPRGQSGLIIRVHSVERAKSIRHSSGAHRESGLEGGDLGGKVTFASLGRCPSTPRKQTSFQPIADVTGRDWLAHSSDNGLENVVKVSPMRPEARQGITGPAGPSIVWTRGRGLRGTRHGSRASFGHERFREGNEQV